MKAAIASEIIIVRITANCEFFMDVFEHITNGGLKEDKIINKTSTCVKNIIRDSL